MIPELSDLTGNESWDELRTRYGEVLGLDEPVPSATLRRAMFDSNFAHRLLVSRKSPKFLAILLSDPENNRYDVQEEKPADAPAFNRSNLSLAKSAASAMLAWGRAGFTQVDEETYQHRMNACSTCPNLVQAPDRLIYKIRLRGTEDTRICNLCGCVASRKARIPTETCPGAEPSNPTMNRWGEPRPAAMR